MSQSLYVQPMLRSTRREVIICVHVVQKCTSALEWLRANRTGERLRATFTKRMTSFVDVVRGLLVESLSTDVTYKRFLASVRSTVLDQIITSAESLAADVTGVVQHFITV